MTYNRLPYDEASTPSEMASDGLAAYENLPGQRSVESAVSEEFDDYPAEAPTHMVVPDQAAALASGLELHL